MPRKMPGVADRRDSKGKFDVKKFLAGDAAAKEAIASGETKIRKVVIEEGKDGGVSIRTEFFFRPDMWTNLLGRLQLFIWDVETLREDATTWEPRTRWQYGEDATPNDPAAGYGFRTATYRGQRVLEVSYLSFGNYAHLGDVLDVGR